MDKYAANGDAICLLIVHIQLRTNAYMAQQFVDEKELAMMADQLKTLAPIVLARWARLEINLLE